MNEGTRELLWLYVHEVLRFRKALNLTSISQPDAFWARFVQPSLDLLPMMPEHGRMMDIGSGMGVPGLPLMIAREGLFGVLVERRKKRAEFLRHLLRRLRIAGEVHDADVRDVSTAAIDVFTARAVTTPDALLRLCTPHARVNAVAVLPVGRNTPADAPEGWALQDVRWTKAVEPQRILCFRRQEVSRET